MILDNKIIEELNNLELIITTDKSRYMSNSEKKQKQLFVFYCETLDRVCAYKLKDIQAKRYDRIEILNAQKLNDEKLNKTKFIYDTKFNQRIEKFMQKHQYSALDIFMSTGFMKYKIDKEKEIVAYITWYLKHPFIEQLIKSGFTDLLYSYIEKNRLKAFESMFKQASDIQGITGLPNSYWTLMKDKLNNCDHWNGVVNFIKKYNIQLNTLKKLLQIYKNRDTIYYLEEILSRKEQFPDCDYYTVDSLLSYADKCRINQGLFPQSALTIINDYLSMCEQLNVTPTIKNENLEKDHDIISVTYNRFKEEEAEKKHKINFNRQYKRLKKYEFEDERLKVVIPTCAADLFEEGRNNHNCVASYVDKHANGQTDIFFIRNKEDEDKSYITVEVNEEKQKILQAYYSYNRKINKEEDLQFIDNWFENCFGNQRKEQYA